MVQSHSSTDEQKSYTGGTIPGASTPLHFVDGLPIAVITDMVKQIESTRKFNNVSSDPSFIPSAAYFVPPKLKILKNEATELIDNKGPASGEIGNEATVGWAGNSGKRAAGRSQRWGGKLPTFGG